ncbi:hypothetical protein BC829DRAFT_379630 [Chytridium lagenaria]|nr:hypothetical protein BC829DRAFT_379630 [Chytridium lagenaria]
MDESIKQFMEDKSLDARETIIARITNDISSKSYDLVELVQRMGLYLVSSDPFQRADAISLLCSVAERITMDFKSSSVILEFLAERLHDQMRYSQSLVTLSKGDYFTAEFAETLIKRIFAELSVQSFPQGVRSNVFKIFHYLLSKYDTDTLDTLAKSIPHLKSRQMKDVSMKFWEYLQNSTFGQINGDEFTSVAGVVEACVKRLSAEPRKPGQPAALDEFLLNFVKETLSNLRNSETTRLDEILPFINATCSSEPSFFYVTSNVLPEAIGALKARRILAENGYC